MTESGSSRVFPGEPFDSWCTPLAHGKPCKGLSKHTGANAPRDGAKRRSRRASPEFVALPMVFYVYILQRRDGRISDSPSPISRNAFGAKFLESADEHPSGILTVSDFPVGFCVKVVMNITKLVFFLCYNFPFGYIGCASGGSLYVTIPWARTTGKNKRKQQYNEFHFILDYMKLWLSV